VWPREVRSTKRVEGALGKQEGSEKIDTVVVLVEEAESFLELGNLVFAELVRHGDGTERPRRRGKHARLRVRVNGAFADSALVRETGRQLGFIYGGMEWNGPTIDR